MKNTILCRKLTEHVFIVAGLNEAYCIPRIITFNVNFIVHILYYQINVFTNPVNRNVNKNKRHYTNFV